MFRTQKIAQMLTCMFLMVILFSAVAYAQSTDTTLGDELTFRELLEAGGWVMIIIEILSVLVVAFGIFCIFIMRRRYLMPQEIRNAIMNHVKKSDFKNVLYICEQNKSLLARVLKPGFKKVILIANTSTRKIKDAAEIVFHMQSIHAAIEGAGVREVERLRGFVIWFSHIGVTAPMLGLLGTVLGMIRAFGAIAFKVETGKPVLLSSAISQAMVTTAGGLIVGIFAMILFYYFSAKVNQIVSALEMIADDYMDEIERQIRLK